jgi:hypothetical protein
MTARFVIEVATPELILIDTYLREDNKVSHFIDRSGPPSARAMQVGTGRCGSWRRHAAA